MPVALAAARAGVPWACRPLEIRSKGCKREVKNWFTSKRKGGVVNQGSTLLQTLNPKP